MTNRSHSPYSGTTMDRINFAASYITRGRLTTRTFDTCFEMGDGDDVARGLVRRSLKNERLAAALPRYINPASIERFTKELNQEPAVNQPVRIELRVLVDTAVKQWTEFDTDEPVNGAQLVEWFANWRELAKIALKQTLGKQ